MEPTTEPQFTKRPWYAVNEVTLPNGTRIRARIEPDDSGDKPWEVSDGHGPIRHIRYDRYGPIPKEPGERVLWAGRGEALLYDYEGAVKLARKEWIRPESIPEDYTLGSYAAKLAEEDFRHLKAWCDDEWTYVGVVLKVIRADGFTKDFAASLWGIESDDDEYLLHVANDLLSDILEEETAHDPEVSVPLSVLIAVRDASDPDTHDSDKLFDAIADLSGYIPEGQTNV